MTAVKFVAPTEELIKQIADDMRQEDIDEVWASHRYTPIKSLMNGWRVSTHTAVAVDDEGHALVMFGLVPHSTVTGMGIIWMLGNNRARKYPAEFMIETPKVLDEMMTICPRLCNMVHSKNRTSIRWLKRLGFEIEAPIPHGPDGELFHRFKMER